MRRIIVDIETNGLISITDKLSCISYLVIGERGAHSFYGPDEKEILESFWEFIQEDDTIITFNGDSFDIPFIIKRSIILGIRTKKIKNKIDLRKVVGSFYMSYNKYEKGTLNDWANILGFGNKTTNGMEMLRFYEEGDFESIRQHCEEDIMLTKLLYDRCIYTNVLDAE